MHIFLINGEIWQYFDEDLPPTNAFHFYNFTMYTILKWQVKSTRLTTFFKETSTYLFPPAFLIWRRDDLDRPRKSCSESVAFSVVKEARQKAFP